MERLLMGRVMRLLIVAVAITISMSGSEAQSTECVNSLMPCADYLKSENPPASCCSLLKEAFGKNKECLCSIFTNAALLHSLGATPADASKLSTRCSIAGASPGMCSSSSSSSPSPAPASTNSPATSSGKNGGDVVAWNVISFGLALITSLLFY